MTRRSMSTTTVLSPLSLTTRPCITLLGIALSSRLRLDGSRSAALAQNGLDPRDVAPHDTHTHRRFELTARLLKAQIELLLLERRQSLGQLVVGLAAEIHRLRHRSALRPLDDARLDRQLRLSELESAVREISRDAIELEQDAPRMDAHHPIFGRALARPHAHLSGLRRHRYIREDADPETALTLHVASNRPARRLDLPGGDPLGLQRLQAERAEIQRRAGLGDTADPALMGLAVLGSLRTQHFNSSPLARRLLLGRALVLRHRMVRENLTLEDPH